MNQVVGVRLQRNGAVLYFDPAGLPLAVNDRVIVATEAGQRVGWVVIAPAQLLYHALSEPLPPLLRKATPEDLASQNPLKPQPREVAGPAPLENAP